MLLIAEIIFGLLFLFSCSTTNEITTKSIAKVISPQDLKAREIYQYPNWTTLFEMAAMASGVTKKIL